MALNRRQLLHLVGQAGGAAAAYHTMAAMGLLAVPAAYAGPPALPAELGKGLRVVILGAGIAGMVTALELRKAGFDCLVLEARNRPGGRNWTLRAGDAVEEAGSTQRVAWDAEPHLYFNAGPARLPYHHQGILSYCRELGVELEVLSNDNRGAYLQDDAAFDGKPQRARQAITDTRGFVAELAAKALDRAALADPVTAEDLEKLKGLLRAFGALDKDLAYHGSGRGGYAEAPGGGFQRGKWNTPLDMRQILNSEFWMGPMQFGEGDNQAATMLQPVGGMDRIPKAIAAKLRDTITYGAEVTQIRKTAQGARVTYRQPTTGKEQILDAAYVVCTCPVPALKSIDIDFAPATKAALSAVEYIPAVKIAYQADRRFWELDDFIYGGISWTSRDITQVWYPTAGIHRDKGILVGAYIWSTDIGEAFAAKAPAERLTLALASGERLHPGLTGKVHDGVSVAWRNIPRSGGGWAEWNSAARKEAYPVLLQPDGPIYFAGEHLSYITGWQEGALRSAHYTVGELAKRVQAARA